MWVAMQFVPPEYPLLAAFLYIGGIACLIFPFIKEVNKHE